MQCKDIPEEPIMEWLRKNTTPSKWATWGEGYGIMPTVSECMPPGTPEKLQIAKMRQMINKGKVQGCGCGCRGDYHIDRCAYAGAWEKNRCG